MKTQKSRDKLLTNSELIRATSPVGDDLENVCISPLIEPLER